MLVYVSESTTLEMASLERERERERGRQTDRRTDRRQTDGQTVTARV